MTASAAPRETLLDLPTARLAFSTRRTGDVSLRTGTPRGAVLAARRRLAEMVGLPDTALVYGEQVHGAGVAVVRRGDHGRGAFDDVGGVAGVDALVTRDEGLGLVVLAADCVPLLLVASDAVAAVHAGRRGVEAGVVAATLGTLAGIGVDVTEMSAVLGPAIGACCYEVPAELAERVSAVAPAAAARTTWGAPALDLPAAVIERLQSAGVQRVERVGGCTRCGEGDWFSARAAGAGEQTPGRHAGVVARLPDGAGRDF